MAPLKVSVPLPFFVSVVTVLAIVPVIAEFPLPPKTSGKAPETAPSVSKLVPPAVGLITLNVAAPVRVVAPKVMPAVPLFTNDPPLTVNVCAPMLSVPSVCVTPAPVVKRSDVMVELAETVVLRLKARAVSFASCSVPPLNVSAPAPRAEALVVARRMPALTVVAPV